MSDDNKMPSAEELKDILNVVSETVPGLMEKLTKIMYGEKESVEFGKAVANFYKALTDAGMSSDQAFQLTKQYMSNLSIGNLVKGVGSKSEG